MRETSMSEFSILATDLAKGSFQVCGVTAVAVDAIRSVSLHQQSGRKRTLLTQRRGG